MAEPQMLSPGSKADVAEKDENLVFLPAYTSRQMGDYEDAGFSSSGPAEGYSVCARCFDDEHIAAFIKSTVESQYR